MPEYTCPRCTDALDDSRAGTVRVYPCARCGGHAITLSQLRSVAEAPRFQAFWQAARAAPPAALACPACRRPMRAALVRDVEVDACVACHLVWLDPGEQEKLAGAPLPAPPQRSAADVQADQQVARLLAEEQARSAREQRHTGRAWRAAWLAEILLDLMWWA